MAHYSIWIKVRHPEGLSGIERGNPVRKFKTTTLGAAVALANVALFASGDSMGRGPKKLERGGLHTMAGDHVHTEIIRDWT